MHSQTLISLFLRTKNGQKCNGESVVLIVTPQHHRASVWYGLKVSLHWRHYDHDGVANHQPHGCLLNRLFRRRSKKTSKRRVTGLCVGNSPGAVNSPRKGPVTRKMFPFDDVIMIPHTVYPMKHSHGFVVVISSVPAAFIWSNYPYSSGLLHWHLGNRMIAQVPVKQPWRIWVK